MSQLIPPIPANEGATAPPVATKDDVKNAVLKEVLWGICQNTVLWIGETTFALLPLLTFYIVKFYSFRTVFEALCDKNLQNCTLASQMPLAEMDIIGVVISGLGILSLIEFGNSSVSILRTNIFTYVTGLMNLVLLVVGSLLYAIQAAGIAKDCAGVTIGVLVFSLILSCYLATARGWMDALQKVSLAENKNSG